MIGRRIYIILLLLLVTSILASAPKIRVKATNEPLSSVIKRLNAEVSFDNKALSQYLVTIDKSFSSTDKAIHYLIAGKPLQVRKVEGVFIITIQIAAVTKKMEKGPVYKYIVKKSPDTLSMDLAMSLKEIVITAKNKIPSLKSDDSNGNTHFSSITANVMPGYSDNALFNVLRMMPGIRASGEPSDELYVWGSSPGESRVTLDGIPLFTMQSYNSNISYINPYMAEEVKYKRGVLSANEGSQTGAKVDVISNNSQILKPVFKVMASTMSANVFGAVPIGNRCTISAAYRHTLQSVFGGTTFDAFRKKDDLSKNNQMNLKGVNENGSNSTETNISTDWIPTTNLETPVTRTITNPMTKDSYAIELSTTDPSTLSTSTTITPEYQFQDLNVNVTGITSGKTSYKVTLYGVKDYLDYDRNDTLTANGYQTSYQGGASASLSRIWNNGNRSVLSSFFSELYTKQNGNIGSDANNFNFVTTERVSQYNVKYQHVGIGKIHGLNIGGEFTSYRINGSSVKKSIFQPTVFADERYNIGNFEVEAGLRTDLMNSGIKWQPRTMLKLRILKYFSITSSWGVYNQYLVKNPYAIFENNYQFAWDINPLLKSINTVAGIAFNRGGLNVSAEAYLKKIHNSVWVVNNKIGQYEFDLKGLDVSAKYNWRHGLCFASWSLSDDPRQTDGKANEMKVGGIFHFYPFNFSANYVYGNGYNSMLLPTSSFAANGDMITSTTNTNNNTTYSRMDLYVSYEHRFRYFEISIGTSLINVLDTDNKKYVTSWMPRSESNSFYTQASRFTPVVFVEIKF
jgi:hypothetical protein